MKNNIHFIIKFRFVASANFVLRNWSIRQNDIVMHQAPYFSFTFRSSNDFRNLSFHNLNISGTHTTTHV